MDCALLQRPRSCSKRPALLPAFSTLLNKFFHSSLACRKLKTLSASFQHNPQVVCGLRAAPRLDMFSVTPPDWGDTLQDITPIHVPSSLSSSDVPGDVTPGFDVPTPAACPVCLEPLAREPDATETTYPCCGAFTHRAVWCRPPACMEGAPTAVPRYTTCPVSLALLLVVKSLSCLPPPTLVTGPGQSCTSSSQRRVSTPLHCLRESARLPDAHILSCRRRGPLGGCPRTCCLLPPLSWALDGVCRAA